MLYGMHVTRLGILGDLGMHGLAIYIYPGQQKLEIVLYKFLLNVHIERWNLPQNLSNSSSCK